MPFEAHFKFGGIVVRVFADDFRKLVEDAALIGDIQERVGARQAVSFFHRRPKGFNYYGLRDLQTGEELVFGQMKETFDLFLRREQDFGPPFQSQHDQGGPPPDDTGADPGTPPGPPPQPRAAAQPARPATTQQPARPAQPPARPPAQPPRGAPPTQRRW